MKQDVIRCRVSFIVQSKASMLLQAFAWLQRTFEKSKSYRFVPKVMNLAFESCNVSCYNTNIFSLAHIEIWAILWQWWNVVAFDYDPVNCISSSGHEMNGWGHNVCILWIDFFKCCDQFFVFCGILHSICHLNFIFLNRCWRDWKVSLQQKKCLFRRNLPRWRWWQSGTKTPQEETSHDLWNFEEIIA